MRSSSICRDVNQDWGGKTWRNDGKREEDTPERKMGNQENWRVKQKGGGGGDRWCVCEPDGNLLQRLSSSSAAAWGPFPPARQAARHRKTTSAFQELREADDLGFFCSSRGVWRSFTHQSVTEFPQQFVILQLQLKKNKNRLCKWRESVFLQQRRQSGIGGAADVVTIQISSPTNK